MLTGTGEPDESDSVMNHSDWICELLLQVQTQKKTVLILNA